MKKRTVIKSLVVLILIAGVAIAGLFSYNTYQHNQQAKTITKGTLTVGLEGTYAPYSYREDGKLKGYEVDLAKDIADKMGLKVAYVETKWDSLIAGLGSHRYDVVMNNIGYTKERADTYSLSDYYVYPHTVLIKRDNEKDLKDLKSIDGKKMAQSTTSNYGKIAEKNGAKLVSVPGINEAMNLVKTKRADGSLNDLGAFKAYQKQNPKSKLTYVDLDGQVDSKPSGALVNKDNKKLLKAINKAIEELKSDGTLSKLSEKYFGMDISSSN
ncbi:transporter substrate-binding domain-containing protein [Eupransor demetentiae]|uniref:Periplasmic component/domain (HisJ) n=1 Tax=Eupransor demetentiae TaxID=3109584 RepID=A0ABP0ETB1_9LACO|nr:ABC-type amino acid transport/signal transduction system [Lactobacillaceae bacterium LMG 33000]